ncbi:serine hydrolase domain-containing protein [Sinosporangium siamense]|uniref:Esterase n=1 Tax=Sinosporangium siamense TaxID=1367973 RepID=A0A919V3T0_9ACTN|nr:serine hydrolase domain-containing protein [Sinosporangium siamense]GII89808.1 esterase [Sinosporangium siamense]
MTLNGFCAPGFERVREAMERHFASGEDRGAAFAVFHEGRAVVDLWGGVADRRTGRPWEIDTPVFTYSCTKAVTAAAVLRLAERGELDLDAPVAEVWPEFGVHGKEGTTTVHLLTHQAGLPVIEDEVPVEEFEDLPAVAARLAGQAPLWEPGTAHGYHALTYGFLLNEVVRRACGRSLPEVVAEEIAGPLGLELWLGAPPEVAEKAARLAAGDRRPSGESPAGEISTAPADRDSLMSRALGNPPVQKLKGGANHPVVMRAGWPSIGVVATARGLAGFYRALLAGEVVSPATLEDAIRTRVEGQDRVLPAKSAFGLGFMRPSWVFLMPPKGIASSFGHTGMGGFLGVGDAVHGLGMAYTPNRMSDSLDGAMRGYRLVEAVYDSLP